MPRSTNPGDIRVGPGQKAPDPALDAILTSPGGLPPDIGTPDITFPDMPIEGTTGGMSSTADALLKDLFSSWVLEGGVLSFPGALTADIANTYVILRGKKYGVSAASVTVPAVDAPYYFYVDGTTNPLVPAFAYTTSLPLPNPEDILLARADVAAGVLNPLTYINLTNPLQDIDRRVDILVGDLGGWEPSPTPHFATLAEAVAYVGEIMVPASGTSGKQWRIRVIGPTTETAVPILIPVSGIYIESAVAPVMPPIQWSTPATPLFDLNGKDDLTFENLSFKYLNVGQPADPTGLQVVFSNGTSASPVDRLVIRHCRFDGNGKGHGFLLATTAGRQFTSPIIENNRCVATDFGLAFYDTRCSSGVFRNNSFTSVGAQQSTYLDGIHLEAGAGNNINGNRIQDNSIGGVSYSRGVVLIAPATSNPNIIEGNRISRTDEMGIQVENIGAVVRDNVLLATHLSGVFSYGQTAKIGIWQKGVIGTDAKVQNNYVQLDTPAVGSRSIWTEATGCTVSDNFVTQTIQVGQTTKVHNNHLDGTGAEGSIYVGGGCLVTGNTIPNDLVTAAAEDQIHMSDNTIVGAITIGAGGSKHNISNNIVATITLAGSGAIVQGNNATTVTSAGALTALHFTGNTFNTFSVDLILSNVVGNWISQMTNSCTDTVFGDNFFENNITVSGTGNQFNNNHFDTGNVTLNGPATSCVFTSNRVPFNLTVTGGTRNIVGDNRISGAVAITSSDSAIESNVFGSTLTVTGSGNVINGNQIPGLLTLTGSSNTVISSNRAQNVSAVGACTTLHIEGNNFSVVSTDLISSHVVGNRISDMTNSCTDTIFGDNTFESNVTVSGSGNQFSNNYFDQGDVLLDGPASNCLFNSNRITFTLTVTGGTKNTVADNRIGGAVVIDSSSSTATGNLLDSTLDFTGADSVVGDNIVGGAVTVTGNQGTVKGNTFKAAVAIVGNLETITGNINNSLSVTGTSSTISGNAVASTFSLVGGTQHAVTGNFFRGSVSSTGTDTTFSQNSGNDFDWTLSGTSNAIMGNQLGTGVLIVAGTGNTVIGNITGGIGINAAAAGPQPANTAAVGNRVGAGGSLYGALVVPTTATNDNIQ